MDVMAGGSRNFKIGAYEYVSSQGGQWLPGSRMLSERKEFLDGFGFYEVLQTSFPYRWAGPNREGSSF